MGAVKCKWCPEKRCYEAVVPNIFALLTLLKNLERNMTLWYRQFVQHFFNTPTFKYTQPCHAPERCPDVPYQHAPAEAHSSNRNKTIQNYLETINYKNYSPKPFQARPHKPPANPPQPLMELQPTGWEPMPERNASYHGLCHENLKPRKYVMEIRGTFH